MSPPKASPPTLGRAISLWQRYLEAQRKADSTIYAYVNAVTLLEHAFGADVDPDTITIEDLEGVIATWRRLDVNTVRNRLVAWRQFYRWGARRHGWPRLADEIDLPKRSRPALRRLTRAEVEAMLAQPAVERASSCVWILVCSAVRIGEMQAMRWRDVDLVAGRLTVEHVTAKGRKGRVVPIPDQLVAHLAAVKDSRGELATRDDCYVIPHRRRAQFIPEDEAIVWTERTSQTTIGRMLKEIAREAGVRAADEVTAHMFRRYYLEQILDDGTSDYIAAAIAGHASVQTTAEYGGGASIQATTRVVRGINFGASPARNLSLHRDQDDGRTWDRTKAAPEEPDEVVGTDSSGPSAPEEGA